ncbi:hypothetical protein Dsin_025100 [Dipteronia sinensis]|uniref:Phytocyanin domain-containing protein n=1 Tax=Dipteronia sinensis TaxID=43782 RepID=A0AAD9ZUZ5_9ROSI|nr:hypothetical protein Dsin_025100 [Dipteronia sinensis]
MTALFGVSMAAVYKVGDSAGWTMMGNVDYDKWASTKNFHSGDVIVFEYDNEYHNVKQVTHEEFQSCNVGSPIAVYSSGSDSISLKRPGHYYFLCGYPGHCQAGQKVDVLVTPSSFRSSGSPTSAPYALPPSTMTMTPPNPIPAKNTMALAKKMLAFLVMTALFGVSMAAVYKVGDSAGWTMMGNVDYDKWASTKNFHSGDVIVFEYDNEYHNVKQPERPGHYYFLCGYPGHCQAGQKVDVLVTPSSFRSSGSPTSAPYALPPSTMTMTPPNPIPAKNSASSLHSFQLWSAFAVLIALFVVAY